MGNLADIGRPRQAPTPTATPTDGVETPQGAAIRERLDGINRDLAAANAELRRVTPLGRQPLTAERALEIFNRLEDGPVKQYLAGLDPNGDGKGLRQAVSDLVNPATGRIGTAGSIGTYTKFLESLGDIQSTRASVLEELRGLAPGEGRSPVLRAQVSRLTAAEQQLFAKVPELKHLRAGNSQVSAKALVLLNEALTNREAGEKRLVEKHKVLEVDHRLDQFAGGSEAHRRGFTHDEARRHRMALPLRYEESIASTVLHRQIDAQLEIEKQARAQASMEQTQRSRPLEPGNVNYPGPRMGPGLDPQSLRTLALGSYEASHASPPSGAFNPADVRFLRTSGMLDSVPAAQIDIPARVVGIETRTTRPAGDELERALQRLNINATSASANEKLAAEIKAGKLLLDASLKGTVAAERLSELVKEYLPEHQARAQKLYETFFQKGHLDTSAIGPENRVQHLYLTYAAADAMGLSRRMPEFGRQLLSSYTTAHRDSTRGASSQPSAVAATSPAATRREAEDGQASVGLSATRPVQPEYMTINGQPVAVLPHKEPGLAAALREARLHGLSVTGNADNTASTYFLSDSSGRVLGQVTMASYFTNRDERLTPFLRSHLQTTVPGLDNIPISRAGQPELYAQMTRLKEAGSTITFSTPQNSGVPVWRFSVANTSGGVRNIDIPTSVGNRWASELATRLAQ